MLTTVCLLLSGYGCFMFHLQWQQTILAGSCTFLVYSAQRRVNYIQLHCPARRCTFSSAVMLTAVLTVNHLLCSQRYFTSASVRKRLVRGWHTAVHMTTGPKLARGRGTRPSESCSGGHPEINHGGQILLKKTWNLLVLSEGANFPWCCSWKLRKSRAFRSQLTVVKGQV